jgi:hypothetical protein
MGRIKSIQIYVLVWDKRLSTFNCFINKILLKTGFYMNSNNINDVNNNINKP